MTDAQRAALATRRKRFVQAVKGMHAAKAMEQTKALAARNAYRAAIGLPPIVK